jgi:hypothetical protein
MLKAKDIKPQPHRLNYNKIKKIQFKMLYNLNNAEMFFSYKHHHHQQHQSWSLFYKYYYNLNKITKLKDD